MIRETPVYENAEVTAYWLDHYCTEHCTLCGNSGQIDTRTAKTATGKQCGRINFCICPNGQAMRALGSIPGTIVKIEGA